MLSLLVAGSKLNGIRRSPPVYSPLRARVAAVLLAAGWIAVSFAGCSSAPPANVENICAIFKEKKSWYRDAKKSEERWGTPIHVQLAIIRQESSFRFDARPARNKLLGFIPWTRPSDAYGYAQALDSTWQWYKDDTGRRFADRDDFGDAIDFVGWYTDVSTRTAGISKWDPYNQYLAYHEGQGGWQRGSYRSKRWLMQVARTVDYRAKEWGAQLVRCEDDLDDGWWIF
ncbi:MAG: hypothetical protein R3315_12955 [Woeseiaceae bacterium]|nr:hypothetical protein [Woeseiaceae bacterium]